jgi:hypothetical protein
VGISHPTREKQTEISSVRRSASASELRLAETKRSTEWRPSGIS